MTAWVDAGPARAEALGGSADPQVRSYGPDGVPVLLETASGHPFPGPILFDGADYYLKVVQEGHPLQSRWVQIPGEMLDTKESITKLGDLRDSLMWFWVFDPRTALRVSEPAGELVPGASAGTWTLTCRLDPSRLHDELPALLINQLLPQILGGWTIELTADAQGKIEAMTLNGTLDTDVSIHWSWSRAEEAPQVPQEAIAFGDAEEALR
ncbi:MAG: hypothetical protein M5U22_08320 [Thermoleophilia bacterium]|nr:hypothetical protein [Thermoleophilia bacterium]